MNTNGSLDTAGYLTIRNLCAALGRVAMLIDAGDLDEALRMAEVADAAGPVLDPSLAIVAGEELRKHIALLRAVRDFRAALEPLRPAAPEPAA